jgi:hypothetical protein
LSALAAVFVDIALHRSGPDRLPSTPFLVAFLLALYFPVNLVRLYVSGAADGFDYVFVIIDTLLFFAFVYGVLRFFGRSARFRQTASALLGTDILINLIGIPVSAGGSAVTGTTFVTILSVVYLVLFLWWIDVAGFIISKAIEQPYVVGVMFTIFYVVAALSVLSALTQTPA